MSKKTVIVHDYIFRARKPLNFETEVQARVRKEDLELALRIIKKDRFTFENLSHYIRCAIIKQNREFKKRLKL